jgi:hypothetical protein
MEFRDNIESVLAPLITELREKLASLPTLVVLNHYQQRILASAPDKSNVPDAYIFKWRYLWALLLSSPFSEAKDNPEAEFAPIDEQVEKIFETYSFGAIYEPGRSRGSEKEFLTRLGLAINVREPDILGFPEQIRNWGSARLQPFDESYFLPVFGLRFDEIVGWVDRLIRTSQSRVDSWLTNLASICAEMKPIQTEFVRGNLDVEAARNRASELKIDERLDSNGRESESIHIFSIDELQCGIPQSAVQALIKQFGIKPGEVGPGYVCPHDDNPLEYKTLVVLPDANIYFLDPANAYRVVAKTFEKAILADAQLRDRYLKNRDRATESLVAENMLRVFPSAAIYPNYYLEKGSHEKDLFVRERETLILIECKNSRVRTFKGTASDLLKFERDFEHSVQFGFEQASEAKRRILESEETTFFDEKGQIYFSVKRAEVKRIYIVCVTVTPRGPFGTDLSYQLKKSEDEPFPLAVNLFDFDTICKHLSQPEQFIGYLLARERLHGRIRTGDELNYAGYFLKHGNLDFEDGTLVNDDFSGIFDRRWYREKGIEVEEPSNPPALTSVFRKGNELIFEHSTGRKEVIKIAPELIEKATGRTLIRMKGSDRNKLCPCGSGRKLKNCCGIN